MSKRCALFARRERDLYLTPASAVAPLARHLLPGRRFVEPCAADGGLVRHFEALGHRCVGAFDIAPLAPSVQFADARDLDLRARGIEADEFFTNPPWSRDLLHAIIEALMGALRCRLEAYAPGAALPPPLRRDRQRRPRQMDLGLSPHRQGQRRLVPLRARERTTDFLRPRRRRQPSPRHRAHISPARASPMSNRFLRLPEVKAEVGLSAATIYRMIPRNEFPTQVRLTKRCVGWWEADIRQWKAQREPARSPS